MYGWATDVLEVITNILNVFNTKPKIHVLIHVDGARYANKAPPKVATDMSKNIADAQQSHCQSSLHRLANWRWDWLITPPKRANANLLDCTASVVMIQLAAPMHANCHTPGDHLQTIKIGHIITSVNISQTQINAALLMAAEMIAIHSKQDRGDATNNLVAYGMPGFNYAKLCLARQDKNLTSATQTRFVNGILMIIYAKTPAAEAAAHAMKTNGMLAAST